MMRPTIYKGRGTFFIPRHIYEDYPGVILELQKEIIINHFAMDYMRDGFRYGGFAPFFEETKEGEAVPSYGFEWDKKNDTLFVRRLPQEVSSFMDIKEIPDRFRHPWRSPEEVKTRTLSGTDQDDLMWPEKK